VGKGTTPTWMVADAPTLTDQFGHTYSPSGVGYGFNHEYEPLTGPAASVGGRLTLHVTSLTLPPTASAAADGSRGEHVNGDWTLHATLFLQPAPTLALPRPVTSDGSTYRLTSARASGLVVVHWRADGSFEQLRRNAYAPQTPDLAGKGAGPGSAPPPNPFRVTVTGPDGREALERDYGYGVPRRGPITGEVTFVASLPGTYRIRIGSAPELDVSVPAGAATGA
jgi:hypothetical protein